MSNINSYIHGQVAIICINYMTLYYFHIFITSYSVSTLKILYHKYINQIHFRLGSVIFGNGNANGNCFGDCYGNENGNTNGNQNKGKGRLDYHLRKIK